MKKLLFFITVVMLFSCQKEFTPPINKNGTSPLENYQKNVTDYLKQNLSSEDFKNINPSSGIRFLFDSGKSYFLKIPINNKSQKTDFLALQTDTLGNCSRGNIIHYDIPDTVSGKINKINIDNLQRTKNWNFDFTNQYTPNVVIDPYLTLDPVIVYGTVSGGGSNISFSNLLYLLNPGSAVQMSGGGLGITPRGTGNGGTWSYYINNSTPIGGGGITQANSDRITFEDPLSEPGADIVKIFNCFDALPDAGATFKMSIRSALPDAVFPLQAFAISPWDFGNPGHSFITITKTNGSQSVTKSFGFYPTVGWESVVNLAGGVPSKIVNNSSHYYNASITKDINIPQFKIVKNKAIEISPNLYSLANDNCTNNAISIFNSKVGPHDQIKVEPFNVYISATPVIIVQSPQKLYKYIEGLCHPNSTDEFLPPPGVEINRSVFNPSKAPYSPGECN